MRCLTPLLGPDSVQDTPLAYNTLGTGVLDWDSPALVLVLELHLPAVHVTVVKKTSVIHTTISDAAIKLHLLRVSALDWAPGRNRHSANPCSGFTVKELEEVQKRED